jgi:hypothetical protein
VIACTLCLVDDVPDELGGLPQADPDSRQPRPSRKAVLALPAHAPDYIAPQRDAKQRDDLPALPDVIS